MYFGRVKVDKDAFHNSRRPIKKQILADVKDCEHVVGTNPDVAIINGKIVLKGNGKFAGNIFPTELDPMDYFEDPRR